MSVFMAMSKDCLMPKRKRRDHPEVIFWDQISTTARECHALTKRQHGYLQLLSQIATLTRHDDMVEHAQKWNDEYEFTTASPEEIRQFLDQWWESFTQARTEHSTAREKAVAAVREAAKGSADDISKAALALASIENEHAGVETVLRRWARIVRAPKGWTLDTLPELMNTYVDRWLSEWGETAAKLAQMVDGFEKLCRHRRMQQESSD